MGGRDIDATMAENDLLAAARWKVYGGWALLAVAALGWLVAVWHLTDLLTSSAPAMAVPEWEKSDWAILLGVPLGAFPVAVAGATLLAIGSVTLRLRRHESYIRYLNDPPKGLAALSTDRSSRPARRARPS